MFGKRHQFKPDDRIRHFYRAADTRKGEGYGINRSYRMDLERAFDEHCFNDIDALMGTEPGSDEAAEIANRIREKRPQTEDQSVDWLLEE